IARQNQDTERDSAADRCSVKIHEPCEQDPSGVRPPESRDHDRNAGHFGVPHWIPRLVCAAAIVAAASVVTVAAEAASPNRTAIEALKRLKDVDLESNPTLKAAVERVLESAR